jgi:hypothetical protein
MAIVFFKSIGGQMAYSEQLLSSAATDLRKAAEKYEYALTRLDEIEVDGVRGAIDRDKPIVTPVVSMSLLLLRINSMQAQLSAMRQDIPLASMPIQHLEEIQKQAAGINQKLDEFVGHINNVHENGGFKPTAWVNFEIGNPPGNMNQSLVGGFLEPIFRGTEKLLSTYNAILPVTSPGAIDFSSSVESVLAAEQSVRDIAKKLAGLLETATKSEKATEESASRASAASKAATEIEAAIKNIRDTIVALEGDTRAKKGEADATLTAAAALKAQVDDYAAQFAAFQTALIARNAALAKGNKDLESLTASLKKSNEDIIETIARAKTMLATATNAGLTAAQENRFNKLDGELIYAGWATYFAFFLLFASLSPLGAYIWSSWDKTIIYSGSIEYLMNVTVRSILLAPALLFVGFTTSRYRRLFRLKHEYGFRASLAGAVEGFKTQAPEHGEDIAAVAFYQLGRNPAEAIDGKIDNPPWYDKLLHIIQRFGDRFGHADKAAEKPAQ